MSETPFTIVSGVIPCSSLYASWTARRRFVSSSASLIASVCLSAYISTLPLTFRAARPIVWISARPPAQEALLVGVEDRDERHLRQVEPLAQQVDADEDVVLAEPQLADDLDPLERVDLGVEVARLHARLEQVVGQVLGHLLRQRRDEHALARLLALADLVQQVVDLVLRRAQLDLGVDDAGRPDQLLGDDRRVAELERPGRRGDEHELRHLARGTRRSAAAGCRAPTAAGSRSRRASACASGRPRTCRRSAAPSGATRRRRRRSRAGSSRAA